MDVRGNLGIQHDLLYVCCQYFPLSCCYPCNVGHQCIHKVVQLSECLPTAAMDVRVNLGIQHDPLYACCRYFPLLCCYPWNIGHQCIRKVVQLSERPTTAAMDVRVNLGIQHTHCMRVANISRYCVVIFATLATSGFAKLYSYQNAPQLLRWM
jgi:hypothetical protein